MGHTWNIWRPCTKTSCWSGKFYGGGAGLNRTDGGVLSPNWETDGSGKYRIKPAFSHNWCRLLIRAACGATTTTTTQAAGVACETTTTQLAYSGYVYRTLYGTPIDGTGHDGNEEKTYKEMPAGYEVAPDDTDIATNVIKPHTWNVWRPCTQTSCWAGKHYGGS